VSDSDPDRIAVDTLEVRHVRVGCDLRRLAQAKLESAIGHVVAFSEEHAVRVLQSPVFSLPVEEGVSVESLALPQHA